MQAGQTPYPFYGGAPTTAPGMTPEQELDSLKNQAQVIRGQLEHIESRIRDLEVKER
jgi:hypothetical protein